MRRDLVEGHRLLVTALAALALAATTVAVGGEGLLLAGLRVEHPRKLLLPSRPKIQKLIDSL